MKHRMVALVLAVITGVSLAGAQEVPGSGAENDVSAKEGLEAWSLAYSVFSHPRCANCHVEGEFPMWSGLHYGETRIHGFNVKRGSDESGFGNPGLRCTVCHLDENSAKLHGPPGAEGWHLAPAEMVWFARSSREICEQIKDPERNGGRTIEEIALHVRDDGLVAWGWAPGPGREAAPGSAEETFQALTRWLAADAPCPEED